MRSQRTTLKSLMGAAMIAAMGAGLDVVGPRLRDAGEGNNRVRHRPPRNTALEREIAEHNEAVDRLKAEKRAAKRAA